MLTTNFFLIGEVFCNDTLHLNTFLKVVQEHHPLIKKAKLYNKIGDAYNLIGKGTLDPKIQSEYQTKNFDGIHYFTVWQSEVKVPTTLPIDFSLGYENNNGIFLNNENSVPSNGLVYGTINLSLLRGLLFNEQRYQMANSELLNEKNQIDKEILVRETLIQSVQSYLDWAYAQSELILREKYKNLVADRHQNIVQLFINGDKPAVDTLESKLNMDTAEKLYLDAWNELIKKRQGSSLFLWNEKEQPLVIQDIIVPQNMSGSIAYLENIVGVLEEDKFQNDPYIKKFENRTARITLENRLQSENLKPQLDLKYNTILNLGKDEFNPKFTTNDYKYGVTLEYPILNRKTKGKLRLNEAIIQQINQDKNLYAHRLTNKLNELTERKIFINEMLQVVLRKLTNSQLLYEAEILKFELGESSVFLLNQRELKLLEAEIDRIEALLKLGKIIKNLLYLKLGQL